MTILNALMSDLNTLEGNEVFVYDDATGKPIGPGSTLIGHPTIGVGRALDTHGLSNSEINILLAHDCNRIISWCQSNLSWFSVLSDTRQRVICNMVFQIGETGFSCFRHLYDAIARQDWPGARAAMLDSIWAQKETPSRAQMLADSFLQDNYLG